MAGNPNVTFTPHPRKNVSFWQQWVVSPISKDLVYYVILILKKKTQGSSTPHISNYPPTNTASHSTHTPEDLTSHFVFVAAVNGSSPDG